MDIQSLPYLSLLNPSSCLYFGQVTQSPWYHLGLNSCLVPLFMVNIVELMQHPSKSIVPLSFSTIKTGKLKMHPPQTFFIDYVTHFLPMRSMQTPRNFCKRICFSDKRQGGESGEQGVWGEVHATRNILAPTFF